jgi:hypothetical protein
LAEPTGIGGALSALATSWGMESPLESAAIVATWGEIVGPEVAAKCRPTSLKAGVLRVRTDSPAWASEFRYLAAEVIKRINGQFGREVVKEVKPWVGPAVKENRSKPVGGRTGLAEASARLAPGVLADVDAVAEKIGDEKVAAALRKALVAAKIRQEAARKVVQLRDIPSASKAPSRSRTSPRGN